jgi:hypothetical protein
MQLEEGCEVAATAEVPYEGPGHSVVRSWQGVQPLIIQSVETVVGALHSASSLPNHLIQQRVGLGKEEFMS